ncbi:MAG: hypothetical protein U0790_25100 [Isosphaeraceae bacterium]
MKTNKDGKPLLMSKFYNLAFGPKADLRADTEAILNRSFTDEAKEGYDVTQLVDQACRLNVKHDKREDGSISDFINSVTPLDEDDPDLEPQDWPSSWASSTAHFPGWVASDRTARGEGAGRGRPSKILAPSTGAMTPGAGAQTVKRPPCRACRRGTAGAYLAPGEAPSSSANGPSPAVYHGPGGRRR